MRENIHHKQPPRAARLRALKCVQHRAIEVGTCWTGFREAHNGKLPDSQAPRNPCTAFFPSLCGNPPRRTSDLDDERVPAPPHFHASHSCPSTPTPTPTPTHTHTHTYARTHTHTVPTPLVTQHIPETLSSKPPHNTHDHHSQSSSKLPRNSYSPTPLSSVGPGHRRASCLNVTLRTIVLHLVRLLLPPTGAATARPP